MLLLWPGLGGCGVLSMIPNYVFDGDVGDGGGDDVIMSVLVDPDPAAVVAVAVLLLW